MKDKIVEKLLSMGLDAHGFMKVRTLESSLDFFRDRQEKKYDTSFEEKDLSRKIDLTSEMKNANTIISVAFPYYYDSDLHSKGYFSLYTLGKDYHLVVKAYLEKVAELIRESGYEAKVFSDNNGLPERFIAYTAGVGDIGRNHMLVTKKYGSYVFLGEILTDLQVETTERPFPELFDYEICGVCQNCLKACPTKILGQEMYDTQRCLSYITQKKEVTDQDMLLFKGRLFGCDTCQRVCPLNKGIEAGLLEEFRPREYMKYPDLDALLDLTNQAFFQYKETSSGWRGKKLLQRNALIELKRRGEPIHEARVHTEYLKAYLDRLEKLFPL